MTPTPCTTEKSSLPNTRTVTMDSVNWSGPRSLQVKEKGGRDSNQAKGGGGKKGSKEAQEDKPPKQHLDPNGPPPDYGQHKFGDCKWQ